MPHSLRIACAISLFALGNVVGFAAAGSGETTADAVQFLGADYLHRWSQGEQHEFTPQGQDDLKHWSDMITIVYHRNAKDGEGLAAIANSVLELYKNNRAMVLKTNSVPRTPTSPAEHLVVVVLGRPEFIEVAFARFKLVNGLGLSVVYSHRIYGKKIGDEMSAWLKDHGPSSEKALMGMQDIPLLEAAKN